MEAISYRGRLDADAIAALRARFRRRGWALGGSGIGLAVGAQALFAAVEPVLPSAARLPVLLAAVVVRNDN